VAKRKPNRNLSLRRPAEVGEPYTTEVMSYFQLFFQIIVYECFEPLKEMEKRNKMAKMAPGNSSHRHLVWILVSTQAEHFALG
jgi:hypothetical protein